MNNNIQKEKIVKKFNLLKNHIIDLIEYNNLTDYNNTKKFTIKINYYKEITNNTYNYNISILRGMNNPEKTLNVRFNSDEKINDLIETMIKDLFKNQYLSYTSFNKKYNDINKYVLNFKNDVNIEFYIKDKLDKEFYENLNKEFNNEIIINNNFYSELTEERKDELQRLKAVKILDNIQNIFSNVININNIENYDNLKPYKLLIQSKYDVIKECYVYNFNIIRGNIIPEIIVEYSLSIKNNDIVLNKLNYLIERYINSNDLLYKCTLDELRQNKYQINLKNYITIELVSNIEKDNKLYDELFNTSKKLLYTKK